VGTSFERSLNVFVGILPELAGGAAILSKFAVEMNAGKLLIECELNSFKLGTYLVYIYLLPIYDLIRRVSSGDVAGIRTFRRYSSCTSDNHKPCMTVLQISGITFCKHEN
jgi:hypothetical protein